MRQVAHDLDSALDVLFDDNRGRLGEKLVNLLEGLVLGLGHEEDLVEPTQDGDTSVETERETDTSHRIHHRGKVVGDDEGAQEEVGVRSGHAVTPEISGEDLGGNDPGQAGIGAEEPHVKDDTGQIETFSRGRIGLVVDGVACSHEHQTDEETRKHNVGPVASTEPLHVQHCGNSTDQQGSTSNERHIDTGTVIEADLRHQNTHVVHNCVHTRKLTEEYHDVGVDHGAASPAISEKVQPSPLLRVGLFFVLRGDSLTHAQKFLLGLVRVEAANALPHTIRLDRSSLVHQVTGALRHEEHTDQKDG